MNSLDSIVFDGKTVELKSLSIEKLTEMLEKINTDEIMIKQELDSILKRLS